MRDYKIKPWLWVVCIALLVPCGANAAGLGRINVLSSLGQPLNAEIELLSVAKNETINARFASPDTYTQGNMTYNPALAGARITVQQRPNGQMYLHATTSRSVNEPFLELIVEMSSQHGRVTRQYTALLDPPGYGKGRGRNRAACGERSSAASAVRAGRYGSACDARAASAVRAGRHGSACDASACDTSECGATGC